MISSAPVVAELELYISTEFIGEFALKSVTPTLANVLKVGPLNILDQQLGNKFKAVASKFSSNVAIETQDVRKENELQALKPEPQFDLT